MSSNDIDPFTVPTGEDVRGATVAESAPDPFTIPELLLPSGSSVYFRTLHTVTAANVRWLRASRDKEGAGSFYNELTQRGMQLFIVAWDLPRLPKDDAKITDKLNWNDLRAIERHLNPFLLKLIGDEDEDGNPAGE